MRRTIRSPEVPATPKHYSQGVRVGDTIYVSGQLPVDRAGNLVGKGDMRLQTHQVLKNLRHVLAAEGAALDDVVKLTMFLTDMSRASEAREVRCEYFLKDPPASTGVEVSRLTHPDFLVEIDAIAVLQR